MSRPLADPTALQDAPAAAQKPVQTLPLAEPLRQADARPRPTTRPTDDVYIAAHALDLLQIDDLDHPNPQRIDTPGKHRDLDQVVHAVLAIGLTLSGTLMIIGLILGLVLQRAVPETMPAIAEIFGRIIGLRPSGFLALGLLVLIATPILRVIGSIAAFVYERDWRYAAITTGVLLVLLVSLLIGKEG